LEEEEEEEFWLGTRKEEKRSRGGFCVDKKLKFEVFVDFLFLRN
jgi:hypothetical protein